VGLLQKDGSIKYRGAIAQGQTHGQLFEWK
jgi:hypothetical protein